MKKEPYCKCYKNINVYSKRFKKGLKKSVSLLRYNEEEANQIIEDFKKEIKEDNIKFENEKKENKEIIVEMKGPILRNTDDIQEELQRISVGDIMNKFDTDKASNIIIFGTSKAGKSYLLKKLIEKWVEKDDSIIPIFMVGNRGAEIYKDIINDYPFFDGLKASIVETLHILNSNIEKPYNFLIILDDIVTARYSDVVKNLALSYRNAMINSIYLLQNTTLVNKNSRGNSTVYMFGFNKNEETLSIMDKFLKHTPFFKKVKNIEEKIKLYKKCCSDYNFIVNFPNELDGEMLYITKCD